MNKKIYNRIVIFRKIWYKCYLIVKNHKKFNHKKRQKFI